MTKTEALNKINDFEPIFTDDNCHNCDNYDYCIDMKRRIGWQMVSECPYYVSEDKNNV